MSGAERSATADRLTRTRSPPGAWRIFAPALLAWGCAAIAVLHPGTGRMIAVLAAAVGSLLLSLAVLTRRTAAGRVALLALRYGAVSCAVLVLVGSSIELGERARADPSLARAAEHQRTLEIDVALRGFPQAQVSPAQPRAWAEAETIGASGMVPVVLWMRGDTAVEAASGTGAAPWAPATRLVVRGRLVALEPGSAAAYGVRVEAARIAPTADGRPCPIEEAGRIAAALRTQLRASAEAVPGAALVPGFAVGDTALVDDELARRMQQTSLTHLVAVSGANCALVTGAMVRCAGLLGAGRRSRIVLAGAALAGFVFLVGPDASVQRAALMAAVVLVSGFGGKRAVALPALGSAMLLLLIANPWQALQPGFALSVAATAGILLIVPGLERGMSRLLPVPRWLLLPVAVALAAQLACGPLLLLLQSGIPAAGVLANVLAAPAAPLGTGLGLLALSAAAGEAVTVLAALPARWVASTAVVTAQLPLARWPWPEGWPGALLLAAVECAVLMAGSLLTRRVSLPRDRAAGRVPWRGRRPISTRGRAAVAVLLCAAGGTFAGPTVVAPLVSGAGAPHEWSVVACDVGQGDALLLRDPEHPEGVVLVDTGDEPEMLDACLDRFGVRRIALLVLTHDDRDHVGALGAVAALSDAALVAPDNRADGAQRPVLTRLEAAGIPHRIGEAGERGSVGGLHWEVVAPPVGSTPADTNAASVVLRVRAGELSVLLLADTGADEQRALRASGADLGADIAKVAHHGSRDQDPAFAEAIGAALALVSVGADNGYGHPAAETLDAFEAAGSRTLRTDLHGSIAISGAPGDLRVWVERGEPADAQ
jgi:competence protein ComEC